MFRVALPALAGAWFLQQAHAPQLLALPAACWALAGLCAWWLAGARVALVLLACGWTLVRAGWLLDAQLPEALAGQDVLVRGVVCDFPRSDPQAVRFVLALDAGRQSAALPSRVYLSWFDRAPPIRPGERWQLRVRLRPPRGLRNPGGFDFERWLYVRGIGASGYVRESRLNRPLDDAGPACALGAARGFLAERIAAALGTHPAAGHVLGVAVGATHRLTDDDWELLRRTGTTHLLAISGLNIAMVAAPFLLAGPWLSRIWSGFAGQANAGLAPAVLAATAYSALSGFEVSTVRALVMLMAAALLLTCRRRIEALDVLGTAAMALLVLDPQGVVSVSFWLSFLAVGWLLVAASRSAGRVAERSSSSVVLRATSQLRRAGGDLLRAQAVLGLGLAPVTLAWFQQVSVVAPLTNLVAVPVFSVLVMPLALLGGVLVVPAPESGAAVLRLAADVTGGLLTLLRIAADAPLTVWEPLPAGTSGLLMATVAAAWLCWWAPLPLRACAVALLLPALLGGSRERPQLQVTALDVGQGLAVLVQTPRHALLYDAGPAFRLRDAGESVVLPALRSSGVGQLDAVVISHDDQDHAGGAGSVLRRFPQALLLTPEGSRLRARRRQHCAAGLAWRWDGVLFRIVAPDPRATTISDNDRSCVLHVMAPGFSVLLPGDIERRQEDALAYAGLIETTDVVVAPHHGSRSSSGPALVAATRPRFVVFSTGYRNRWGFPATQVRERWAATGACLLDTAGDGAIRIASGDGGAPRLRRRERIDAAHLWTAGAGERPPCAAVPGT
ncbi:MAG: DNA internalization-related competence protein ComEC/Rec2 [Gammaproteobacteria bacterium]|nr:MAG: DNA internalization-related competence protein ComEC/Rec2 [Gammaproteobacteria bacterium]